MTNNYQFGGLVDRWVGLVLKGLDMAKMHYKIYGNDCRKQGQTEHEYTHQAACGYVRENVTTNGDEVDCRWCLQSIHMVGYHAANKTAQVAPPNAALTRGEAVAVEGTVIRMEGMQCD